LKRTARVGGRIPIFVGNKKKDETRWIGAPLVWGGNFRASLTEKQGGGEKRYAGNRCVKKKRAKPHPGRLSKELTRKGKVQLNTTAQNRDKVKKHASSTGLAKKEEKKE